MGLPSVALGEGGGIYVFEVKMRGLVLGGDRILSISLFVDVPF